ncbi:Copia protein, partial [Durusdinium trenchii]
LKSIEKAQQSVEQTLLYLLSMTWLLQVAFFAAAYAAAASPSQWQEGAAAESCENDGGQGLFQKSLGRVGRSMQHENPMEKRVYLICTAHKAGTELMRNIFHWIFDLMDVKETCRFDDTGGKIISNGTWKQNCPDVDHPVNVRFHNHISSPIIESIRAETAKKGGFKGVMTIRNPLEMVVSSYCYHHRGAEPWNALGDNMTDLAPKEGVPEMARRMLLTVRNMTHAFQAAKPEVYVSHYERITGSSAGFNQTIKEILDFLWGDEISHDLKQRALDATVHEDLHRGEEGFSFHVDGTADGKMGNDGVNHTSDEQELDEARAHLSLLDQDVMEEYKRFQQILGYAPGIPTK